MKAVVCAALLLATGAFPERSIQSFKTDYGFGEPLPPEETAPPVTERPEEATASDQNESIPLLESEGGM